MKMTFDPKHRYHTAAVNSTRVGYCLQPGSLAELEIGSWVFPTRKILRNWQLGIPNKKNTALI
jgi:hypothetical protein